jgi:AcrR family transcriptional regulator
MGRPREHTEATRAELLVAARRMLAEQGPAGLGLRGLALEVDTTTRAIYSLFGSKENLARALYVDGFTQLVGRLEAARATGDPAQDLFAACGAYRAQAVEEPALYRLMCERLVPEFEPTCEDRVQAMRALGYLTERLEACRAAGLILDAPLDDLTRQWWAVLHGLAALEIRDFLGDRADADKHWAMTLAALLVGYAPPAA